MRMRFTAALIAVGLATSGAACGQMAALKAKMAARDGHTCKNACASFSCNGRSFIP